MKIKILGFASSIPSANEDSPCYLINDTVLFDCGYSVLNELKGFGCDISKIKTVVFSHMHHDHYLGLAQLMFHIVHTRPYPLSELTLYGPSDDIERVVSRCCDYLQLDLFYRDINKPRIIPLKSGDSFSVGEMNVEAHVSRHPVQALMYRFTEVDGSTAVFGGDGAILQSNILFFNSCDLLIHDATLGYNFLSDNPEERGCGHSTLPEAISACESAKIKYLVPVHMNADICADAVKKAQEQTTVKLLTPTPNLNIEIVNRTVKYS